MKSNRIYTNKECQQISSQVFPDLINNIMLNTAIDIIAVCRHLKLGPKRANQLLEAVCVIKEEYQQYIKDGVADYKAKEELNSFGIDSSEIFSEVESMSYIKMKSKKSTLTYEDERNAKLAMQDIQKLKKLMEENSL